MSEYLNKPAVVGHGAPVFSIGEAELWNGFETLLGFSHLFSQPLELKKG